jgi:hypothetical protein
MSGLRDKEVLDEKLGVMRNPSEVRPHELGRKPMSLAVLDGSVAMAMSAWRRAARSDLLRHAACRTRFIWAATEAGQVMIAFEEIAEFPGGAAGNGHTRRYGAPVKPQDELKLGHPCLLDGKPGRVAGELYLDPSPQGDEIFWVFNFGSGRYCNETRPTAIQRDHLQGLFRGWLGDDTLFDPEVD